MSSEETTPEEKLRTREVPARELVEKQMVKRYVVSPRNVERFVVVGKTREYLVREGSCRCEDFRRNCLGGDLDACKHILAMRIAKKEGKYETFTLGGEEYRYLRKFFLS